MSGEDRKLFSHEKFFDSLDTDKDGKLNVKEIKRGLIKMTGMQVSPALVNTIIKNIDKDNSGTITKEEFMEFAEKQN